MGSKYTEENLLPALRLFIKVRHEAIALGLTDNGGAIHSVERILDLLSQRIKYPGLNHLNNIKKDMLAERSIGAREALQRGEKVFIEHVKPRRAFAVAVIDIIDKGATDTEIVEYIRNNFQLVLLNREESRSLDRHNRTRISPDRLAEAGITLYAEKTQIDPLALASAVKKKTGQL
ncbi:hypothetical protein [Yersinia intermedia]|uniref:hypothetical protein n=1 Tax=Yersinia intermedia TaxID=631 RepID=UPI00065D2875|nr:hypothetical protein [Yersinia intermedia]CRY84126.1 Uncharacterised protein [Yersinia intermedia]